MAKRVVSMFALAATLLLAHSAGAQEFTNGVRPNGMGNAYTGVASGTAGIFHNPGGIASQMMYQVEGLYGYTPSGSVLNATIVDSKTNPDVAAGVGYSYFFGRGDASDLQGHDIRLALALPVLPERISVGVGGRYLIVDSSDEEGAIELVNGFTLDAGAVFRATDQLQFGVAGKNLIDVCEKDNLCSSVAPTTIAGGLSFGDDASFLVAADAGVDLTSDPDTAHPFFEVGAEYFAGGTVPLRLGYQRMQATSSNLITAGAGVRLKTAGLDASFRMDLDNPDFFFVNGSVSVYF